jgi:hypothetical protein
MRGMYPVPASTCTTEPGLMPHANLPICLREDCTNPVVQTPGKRAKLYCSDTCRSRVGAKRAAKPRADFAAEIDAIRNDIAELHGELAGLRADVQSLTRALIRRRD